MILRLLVAAPLFAAGCSVLYDPTGLYDRDAAPPPIDAEPPDAPPPDAMPPPPDAIPIDADRTQLSLTTITPATLDEGTGDAGGRPALVEIDGADLAPDVDIAIAWADDGTTDHAPTVVDRAVALDGSRAFVAIAVPVNPALAGGASRDARLTFTQDGVSMTIDVTIDGLDELTLAGALDETTLHARYSKITVASNAHATGSAPVILHATAGISLAARLDVDAAAGSGGAHGCDGGTSDAASGCGSGGGGGGANSAVLGAGAGGGGGGFGSTGGAGGGSGGGGAGATSGNDMLVPIVSAPGAAGNRGNGGGGGGTGTLGGSGGNGGGGGGVLELDAGGAITITTGSLRALGAGGSGSAGGGGGGSGGALLVRAGGGIVASGAWLSAPGGAGANATNDGGDGGVGRIRVDTASGSVDAMATTPPAVRGPSWDAATPAITHDAQPTFTLLGQPGRIFGVRVDDAAVEDVTTGAGGTAPVTLALAPGIHQLCAVYESNSAQPDLGRPEATTCVSIAAQP